MRSIGIGFMWVAGLMGVVYLVHIEQGHWALGVLVVHTFMTLATMASENSKSRRHENPGATEDD